VLKATKELSGKKGLRAIQDLKDLKALKGQQAQSVHKETLDSRETKV
jgi:hypothetical protein